MSDEAFEAWAARLLFAEYNRAWAALENAGAVNRALELALGEACELASWGLAGAELIVERRLAAEKRRR